jgi:hypothetical protein
MPSVRSRTALAAPPARVAPALAATDRPERAVVTAAAIGTKRTVWARTICAIARLAASHVRSVLRLRRRDREQHPDADDSRNDEFCQHGTSPINVVGKSAINARTCAQQREPCLRGSTTPNTLENVRWRSFGMRRQRQVPEHRGHNRCHNFPNDEWGWDDRLLNLLNALRRQHRGPLKAQLTIRAVGTDWARNPPRPFSRRSLLATMPLALAAMLAALRLCRRGEGRCKIHNAATPCWRKRQAKRRENRQSLCRAEHALQDIQTGLAKQYGCRFFAIKPDFPGEILTCPENHGLARLSTQSRPGRNGANPAYCRCCEFSLAIR